MDLSHIKKLLNEPKLSPQNLVHLIEELRLYFQVIRVKVEGSDTKLREDAIKEVAELKALFETHPVIQKNRRVVI